MSSKRKLDHKLVFIPPWLRAVQNTYNLPNSDLISLAPLLDILTMEDVSFYHSCTEEFKHSDNMKAFTDTFDMVDLIGNTRQAMSNKQQLVVDDNDSIQHPSTINIDVEQTIQNVISNSITLSDFLKSSPGYTNNMNNTIAAMRRSLSRTDLSNQNYSEHVRDNYVFEMLPIDGNYVGIVFNKADKIHQPAESYKKCIEFLTGMYPFETVAQTSVFTSWAEAISN